MSTETPLQRSATGDDVRVARAAELADGDRGRATPVLWLIIEREIRTRGTSGAFLASAGFILVLLTAAIVLPRVLASDEITPDIGIVGAGSDAVVEAASAILESDLDEDQTLSVQVETYADRAAAEAAVAAGDVELVVLDGREILREGASGFGGSGDVEDALQQAAAALALEAQLSDSAAGVDEVTATLRSRPLQISTLVGAADDDENTARSLIAYGGMMLLYMAVLTFGAWTLQGVTEEKGSRVVEVLLASVKPWQLMAGKVIGLGLLGLAQFVLTVGWALVLIRVTEVIELPFIPVDSAVTLVLWFILGFGLFSVMFAAAGAMAGSMEDAQSVAFPVSLIAIVGFLVSFQVLDDPTGPLATIMSFIPFTAPFVVPVRVAFESIPMWQHALAALLTVVVMVGLIRVAATIYANGALHFAGRLGLRKALSRKE